MKSKRIIYPLYKWRKLYNKFKNIKIKNEKNNNNLINLNIIIVVPNSFNYFQRKVIEKKYFKPNYLKRKE